MIVVLFRSKLTAEAADDYAAMSAEMLDRARQMTGFIDFKTFQADDGERVSVIHWESQASMRAWGDDVRHITAQRLGREKWYEFFRIEIAEVARSYGFERPA